MHSVCRAACIFIFAAAAAAPAASADTAYQWARGGASGRRRESGVIEQLNGTTRDKLKLHGAEWLPRGSATEMNSSATCLGSSTLSSSKGSSKGK